MTLQANIQVANADQQYALDLYVLERDEATIHFPVTVDDLQFFPYVKLDGSVYWAGFKGEMDRGDLLRARFQYTMKLTKLTAQVEKLKTERAERAEHGNAAATLAELQSSGRQGAATAQPSATASRKRKRTTRNSISAQ